MDTVNNRHDSKYFFKLFVACVTILTVICSGCIGNPSVNTSEPRLNQSIPTSLSDNTISPSLTSITQPVQSAIPNVQLPDVLPGVFYTPIGLIRLDNAISIGNSTAIIYHISDSTYTTVKEKRSISCKDSLENISHTIVRDNNLQGYEIGVSAWEQQYESSCDANQVQNIEYDFGLNSTPGQNPVTGISIFFDRYNEYSPIEGLHIIYRAASITPDKTVSLRSPSSILENMNSNEIAYTSNTTPGPLHLRNIELGYLERHEQILCTVDVYYEPVWILRGSNERGDPFTIWLWASDHETLLRELDFPKNRPDEYEIIIHDGKGGHIILKPQDRDFPSFVREIDNILGTINGECCMITQDEVDALKNTSRSVEIRYPEPVSRTVNLLRRGGNLYDISFTRAIFSSETGNDMVYPNMAIGCDPKGLYPTERNYSVLYGMADEYLTEGHLSAFKNITRVPALLQDLFFQ